MSDAYPDRAVPTRLLLDLVKAGRLGQKSGRASARFGQEGRARPRLRRAILEKHRNGQGAIGAEEITDRLFLPMLLEATRVLEEGIVREPADVDMGLILGIGFPPFKGGILRWADSEGAAKSLERLEPFRRSASGMSRPRH